MLVPWRVVTRLALLKTEVQNCSNKSQVRKVKEDVPNPFFTKKSPRHVSLLS